MWNSFEKRRFGTRRLQTLRSDCWWEAIVGEESHWRQRKISARPKEKHSTIIKANEPQRICYARGVRFFVFWHRRAAIQLDLSPEQQHGQYCMLCRSESAASSERHTKYKYNRLIWLPRIHLHIFCRQTYTRPNGSKQFEIYLVGEISEESDWTFLGSGNVFFGIIHPKTSTRWELLFEKSYYVCSLEVYLLLLVDMQSAGWEETINHQMYLRYQWNSVDSA